MRTEILAGEDAAWLQMESATNPMIVNVLVELAERVEVEVAVEVAERIGRLPHFAARVAEPERAGPPGWQAVSGFCAREHVEHTELEGSSDAALREELGYIVSGQLDMRRPLWRLHVIDRPHSGTLLLFRVHHALADGFALVGILASLCDDGPEAVKVVARRATTARTGAVTGALRALGRLVTSPSDPPTSLRRRPGTDKRLAWSEPFALADVKAIARAMSATVNDVMVALVAGALGRHLGRTAREVAQPEIHAMVPVNLRRGIESGTVGNDFGLVILGLPIGIADPLARIHAVRTRMDDLKASPEAVVARGLLRVLGWAPRNVEQAAVSFFGRKTSLVLTNVPGPHAPVSLGGVRVARIMFWVPQATGMGLGISIFSYAGEVTVGVMSDSAIVRDPKALVADLHAEKAALDACLHASRAPS